MINSPSFIKVTNFITFFFILSFIPFYLIYEHILTPILFSIQCVLLLFLLIYTNYKNFNKISLDIFFLLLYILYQIAFNYSYFQATFSELIIICICYLLIYNLKNNKNLFNYFITRWIKLLWLIVYVALFANLLFLFYPSVFPNSETGGYIRQEIYFLGRFFTGSIGYRYSGFFNEPSYFGFFVGINALMLFSLKQKVHNKYLLITSLIVLGIISQSFIFIISMGTIALLYGILFAFDDKHKKIMIYALIITGLFLVYFNSKGLDNNILNLDEQVNSYSSRSSSYINRNQRLENSLNTLKTSSLIELIMGRGYGYIVKKYQMGESSGYLNILIEYGIIGILFLFYYIYSNLKNAPFMQIFIIISLTSLTIVITPWFLLNIVFLKISDFHHANSLTNNRAIIP